MKKFNKQISFRVDDELERFWRLYEFEEGEKRIFVDKLIKDSSEFKNKKPLNAPSQLTSNISAPVSTEVFKFWRDCKLGVKNRWIRELIKKSPQFEKFNSIY